MTAKLDDLRLKLLANLSKPQILKTEIAGLTLYRRDSPQVLDFEAGQIMVSLIVQGHKTITVRKQQFFYQQGQCLFCGTAAPSLFHALDNSPQHPFLSLSLTLEPELLAEVCLQLKPQQMQLCQTKGGVAVFDADESIIDACDRLVGCLGNDEEEAHIAPLIVREIYYRLFFSPCGGELYTLATRGAMCNSILHAINFMKKHYSANMEIANIATQVNMSVSSFYRHFKQVTGVSPLQFQKQIRLHEAKLLLTTKQRGVNEIAYAVGYESPSQFIRDYRRCFGHTPGAEAKMTAAILA